MTNKLYVDNLPPDATEETLRAHFAVHGGVAEVEIMIDRRSGNARGQARVTMTSPTFAERAVRELDGAPFGGRNLRVSDKAPSADEGPKVKVKIVQQFRERNNMTYDIDCDGAPLTLRIFPETADQWRIEARTSDRGESLVVASSGAKRYDVLREVLRAWNEAARAANLPTVDAEAVTKAMYDVRAV